MIKCTLKTANKYKRFFIKPDHIVTMREFKDGTDIELTFNKSVFVKEDIDTVYKMIEEYWDE